MGVTKNLDIDFSGPAFYRIVAQGTLSKDWSDRLAGMEITVISRGADATHTELRGPIRDQAELSGVLESLYELHLPIVKVEQIGEYR